MKTTKAIATVSYNSTSFLDLKLSDFISSGVIEFYAYIKHRGEDDEGGLKDHIHLYLEPSKLIQTTDLNDALIEYVPGYKPLKCLPFKTSKFDDWYMYGLHDQDYLRSKGLEKKYYYRSTDFKTNDFDDLNYKVKLIDLLALTPYESIREAIRQGLTWDEYLQRGKVPIRQLYAYEKAFYSILRLERFKIDNHSIDIDPETGEAISDK